MSINKLGGYLAKSKNGWEISGVNLLDLTKKYTPPFYIYDTNWMIKRYKQLLDVISWEKCRIFFAMKSNYNISLLNTILKCGGSIDAVSPAEVILALKVGFPADRIIYTANNITNDEMVSVAELANGKILFNIGSISRLKKFADRYPGREVCLRFNPGVEAGSHQHIMTAGSKSKFGINPYEKNDAIKIANDANLKVIGIHKHTGSGISDMNSYLSSVKNLLKIADNESFPNLKFIDIGGGFKVPYEENEQPIDYIIFGNRLSKLISDFSNSRSKEISLYLEPGKYLSAECGYFLVKVNTLKSNGKRLIAGTDSGFNQLIRPTLYNAYHHIINISNSSGQNKIYDICGNLCESGDLFAREREITEIREGDYLLILNAGAYCYSMSNIYNLRSKPSEVLIEDGNARIISRAKTDEELADSIIEEYLC